MCVSNSTHIYISINLNIHMSIHVCIYTHIYSVYLYMYKNVHLKSNVQMYMDCKAHTCKWMARHSPCMHRQNENRDIRTHTHTYTHLLTHSFSHTHKHTGIEMETSAFEPAVTLFSRSMGVRPIRSVMLSAILGCFKL